MPREDETGRPDARPAAFARKAPIDILSPALGWQKAPNLGGARYESVASEVLLASGRTRLLLPGSQADGFPRSRSAGRLWLRTWNRPLVLGAYLPLQLVFELLRWRPRVLRLHSMSHLALPGIAGAAVARAVGWRGAVAVHLHHLDETGTAERNRGRVGRIADRVVIRFADRIIVDAHATKGIVEDRFRRARGKVAVAPAALPAAIAQESRSASEGTLRLAFIGRLEARKRPLEFVEVCRRVAAVRPMSATMVGKGPLEHEVMSAIEGLPIEVKGFIPSLEGLYASADVVVCTSTVEGFYLVGLEALQRGVPAIGFDTPVVRELLGPGLQTCLVPDGDVQALATRIAALAPAELDDLRRRALTRAEYFTPHLFAARLQAALLGPIPHAASR
jgi:glycosyltransferase involved in cell wall biosynthesis